MRTGMLLVLAALCGGCSGKYFLTVPDQVAPAGKEVTTVIRLQRAEVGNVAFAAEEACVAFRVEGGPERGAYTDKLGYAGATVPVPSQPGMYRLIVSHYDKNGDDIEVSASLCVWDPARSAIPVDYDSLPLLGAPNSSAVREALGRLSRMGNVCYLTSKPVPQHGEIHKRLAEAGYPAGPVLLWQREQWHIIREGPYNMPRVVVETRLVGQISSLRQMFPSTRAGVTASPVAARSFTSGGLRAVLVGATAPGPNVTLRRSWRELAELGL